MQPDDGAHPAAPRSPSNSEPMVQACRVVQHESPGLALPAAQPARELHDSGCSVRMDVVLGVVQGVRLAG
eukprot:5773977-Prymnesium_polylepis.1